MRRRRVSSALVLALGLSVARPAQSQADPVAAQLDTPVCFGFSFGAWKPALDWHAAGHAVELDSALVPRADGGRGLAARINDGADTTTTLMLFPPWWPAGVAVRLSTLSTRAPTPRDTVSGRATALVPDDRTRQPPISSVRAWRVPCGGHTRAHE